MSSAAWTGGGIGCAGSNTGVSGEGLGGVGKVSAAGAGAGGSGVGAAYEANEISSAAG